MPGALTQLRYLAHAVCLSVCRLHEAMALEEALEAMALLRLELSCENPVFGSLQLHGFMLLQVHKAGATRKPPTTGATVTAACHCCVSLKEM